jgi:hypothetical protein
MITIHEQIELLQLKLDIERLFQQVYLLKNQRQLLENVSSDASDIP